MRKYRLREIRRGLVKTIISCIGWGLLGYLVMTTYVGLFWLGWLTMTGALCIGVVAMDKLIELGW